MEEKKVYKLLKDYPSINKGALAEWDENSNCYKIEKSVWVSPNRYDYLSKGTVTQSPEWFELVTPKRIEMNDMMDHISKPWSELNWYQIHLTSKIDINKHYKQIKQAVENCLNSENTLFDTHQEFLKKYAEDTEAFSRAILEAEERAFNAAREQIPSGPSLATGRLVPASYEYKTFSDYKNETTKHE